MGELAPGTALQTVDGSAATVVRVNVRRCEAEVFNLEIEGLRNYHVSSVAGGPALLVHNRCRLRPSGETGYAHTVFRRGPDGRITHYETFRPQTNPRNPAPWESVARFDGVGDPHYNKVLGKYVETPHVHDPLAPGGVRDPVPIELPLGY